MEEKSLNGKTIIVNESIIRIIENKLKTKPYTKKVGNITKVNSGLMAYEEKEHDYEIGFEGNSADGYAHVVQENNVDELVSPDEVNLSSFKVKNNLNPKIWKDKKLDSRIRLKLLDIADDFTDSLDVTWVKPDDIVITGSIANYNWSKKFSDIDLHIILDYSKVDEREDFVREYFKMKKDKWNESHKDLKIYGFPVEVYVQDSNEEHVSSGVYSIETDEWLIEPDKEIVNIKFNKSKVKNRAADFMTEIDELIKEYKSAETEYDYRQIYKKSSKIFNKIKNTRKTGFKNGKEMNDGNIIFKTLRRYDYIGKVLKLKEKSYNKMNSIK